MIEKTTLRTTGVVMLVVANVLLLFSMLFSMYSGGRPNSGSNVGVFCISPSDSRFQESEYMSVFSGLGLKSTFYRTDSSDYEKLMSRVQTFARREELNHVILLAYGETAEVGMLTAGGEQSVIGLILLMPRYGSLTESGMRTRGAASYPIAVFDSSRPSSVALFEFLSGEDAILSPAMKAPGIALSDIRVSPDANTYLSLRTLTGDPVIDDLIYPGLPEVQKNVARYITTYLLTDETESSDVRGMILINQILKIAPIVILIAGWFFFLSTISRPHSMKGVMPKEPVKEASVPAELSIFRKIERSERYLFALLLPISLAYGAVLCVMMIAVPHYAAIVAALWPPLALIVAALFYLKHIRKMTSPEKPLKPRFLLSLLVSSLFVSGVFLLVCLHISSFGYFFAFPRVLFIVIPASVMTLCLAVCHKIDMFYTLSERSADHKRGFLSAWRFRGVFLIPFIAMQVSAFLSMKAWLFLLSLYFILLVIFVDWFRQRVRRMSGTRFLPALMASVLYVILAFI